MTGPPRPVTAGRGWAFSHQTIVACRSMISSRALRTAKASSGPAAIPAKEQKFVGGAAARPAEYQLT